MQPAVGIEFLGFVSRQSFGLRRLFVQLAFIRLDVGNPIGRMDIVVAVLHPAGDFAEFISAAGLPSANERRQSPDGRQIDAKTAFDGPRPLLGIRFQPRPEQSVLLGPQRPVSHQRQADPDPSDQCQKRDPAAFGVWN